MQRYCFARGWRQSSSAVSVAWRLLVGLLALACPARAALALDAPVVAVPIPPLEWLVKEIAGDAAEVVLLVPPGASAEQYDPTPGEVTRLATARLFLALDIPAERRWLPRLSRLNRDLEVVPLAIPPPLLDWSGKVLTVDALGQVSDRPGLDFHAWNSPVVMANWVAPVVTALSRLAPAHAAAFHQRAARARTLLDALDERLHARLGDHAGRAFLTLHPAWGYFAQHYGLVQLTIEVQGHEPGARTLARLIELAREEGVRQVYVPPQVNERHVAQVARALGAETLVVDDLAVDYPQALERFADSLVRGFEP